MGQAMGEGGGDAVEKGRTKIKRNQRKGKCDKTEREMKESDMQKMAKGAEMGGQLQGGRGTK